MQRVPSRREIAALIPRGGHAAELGVFSGRYSEQIASAAGRELGRLHLVDLWTAGVVRDFWYWDEAGRFWHREPLDGAEAFQAARRRVGERPFAVFHQGDALEWLRGQADRSLDWAYLDDDHSEEHVYVELIECIRVVRPGGWICGHDYAATLPGVVAAVDRFCRTFDLSIDVLTDEPEQPVFHRAPWMPAAQSLNSYAIRRP